MTACVNISSDECEEKFRKVDLKKDGVLDFEEMLAFLRETQPKITEDEVWGIFESIDLDQDGRIAYGEFKDYLLSKSSPPSGSHSVSKQEHDRQSSKASSTSGLPTLLARRPALNQSSSNGNFERKGSKDSTGNLAHQDVQKYVTGAGSFGTSSRVAGGTSSLSFERRQFRRNDKDQSGALDFQELLNMLQRGDSSIQEVEVRKLFDNIDVNKDGEITFLEVVDYLHPANGAMENSAWRKRLREAFDMSVPGPADYVCNDEVQAGYTKAPRATIGKGPGHIISGVNITSPGPAAYRTTKLASVSVKSGPAATFGTSARNLDSSASATSALAGLRRLPGPATYVGDHSVMAHVRSAPRATIGQSKRWKEDTRSLSPGPACYNNLVKSTLPGSIAFGPNRNLLPSLRFQDRKLLRKQSTETTLENQIVGENVTAEEDMNQAEMRLTATSGIGSEVSRNASKELLQKKKPGPGDYDIAIATNVRGGSFGRSKR